MRRKRLLVAFAAVMVAFTGSLAAAFVPSVAYAAPASIASVRVAAAPPAARPLCNDAKCIIDRYIDPFIKAFSALAGVAITASIIYGGIQYSSAGGDPSKVGAAKSRIGKSVGALVFFIFLYAFLNYLIPGGI